MLTARVEDYLEAIFSEEVRGRTATVTMLAEQLKVTKGTVVAAVRRLSEDGFLSHERYGSPALTESGRERALLMYRRHEHLSFLFSGVLGFEHNAAETAACTLEHALDAEMEGRLMALTEFLSDGMRRNLPWAEELRAALSEPARLPRPLSMLDVGGTGSVVRVTAEGSLRKRLLELGLLPGTRVELVRSAPLGDPVELAVRGGNLSLRRSEAATVWICPAACDGEEASCRRLRDD